ncbi:NAD(P)-dependent alcohol dehydrogenase [Micromonospora sp. HUAS LYJ1]|uniref:NAD(P)-dependent alcohol dehydrogenase n=1 Tax=Micromonospora sp. HUAS LYJ1 TaxID=3061626 RepID=UPI002671363A|nr:NAD(P)-dependent alcohol dehydrogenase [Micromonospora sp. HUAS LYJ1]WKU05398.1 NAD(P)-dependent alcohol dehydrogenase [Micromonospora sp. HUAS LYJ1]
MRTTIGWQSVDGTVALQRATFERRDLRSDDIAVRVDYCGVCHSDLHLLSGMMPHYKNAAGVVPGHEFTGTVTAVGAEVTRFAPGDQVAVGTLVDSCGACSMCQVGQENFCLERPTSTYGSPDRLDGTITKGAYSREYVLREKFAYPLPAGLDPAGAAPLMCAGITMWEPLHEVGIGAGSRVAVAGLGGLGHLGVKLAAALGAEVTVLSRTLDKADDARKLGATELLVTTDDAQLARAVSRFDLILDTISGPHDLSPLLRLLTLEGTLSVLGFPMTTSVNLMELSFGRKKLSSSGTGGTRHTADLLAFAAERGITADIELLPSAQIHQAFDRLARGDVRYRFVLDLADLD